MLRLRNLHLQFGQQVIIDDGFFEAKPGFVTGLVGRSGTGKSSILNILSLRCLRNDCHYDFFQYDINELGKKTSDNIKRTSIAYVTQTPEFLSTMNCLDQMRLECEIAGRRPEDKKLLEILDYVGLKSKAKVYPSKLSGGEKQRLAFAMAIAKDAKVMLCDEITSHLDAKYAKKIMTLLVDLAHRYHKIVVVTTHDDNVIQLCDVIYEIKNKQLLLKKTMDCHDDIPALEYTKNKLLPSFFYRVTKSRLKKRALSYVLSSVVCLLTVTILVFSQEIVQIAERVLYEIHYTIADNEIMIQNNTAEDSFHFYINIQRPFDTNTIQKVSELPFIEKMYPYYGYTIVDSFNLNQDYYFTFTSPNGNHQKVTFNPQMFGGEVIFPYFDEQSFQKKYDSEISGAYITPFFLSQLGIDEVEEGALLEVDVYVPSTIIYENDDSIPWVQYQKQHLSLPVSKVLPDNVQDPSSAQAGIYIPYEVFNELNSKVRVEEGQIPFQPSYYKLFVQEGANRKEVSRTLQMIDKKLCVDDPMWRYEAIEHQGSLLFFKVFSQGMFVLSGCLMIVYGFYIDEENRKDRSFYLTRGIGAWRQRYIILGEWMVLWWCVFPFSAIMNFMLFSAKGKFYSHLIDTFPISIGHLMFKTCIIYGVLSFLALVVPMIKAKGGDIND